jgi:hypothetical protein
VTSYTKWDRDAYIERVGGPEEAERRRKALMARQSGQRLAEERCLRQHPSGCCGAVTRALMGVSGAVLGRCTFRGGPVDVPRAFRLVRNTAPCPGSPPGAGDRRGGGAAQ